MKRTTVMIPEKLKGRSVRRARELGISLGEFIRRSMEALLEKAQATGEDDPFLADGAVFRGPAPRDLSAKHDEYLYGGEAE